MVAHYSAAATTEQGAVAKYLLLKRSPVRSGVSPKCPRSRLGASQGGFKRTSRRRCGDPALKHAGGLQLENCPGAAASRRYNVGSQGQPGRRRRSGNRHRRAVRAPSAARRGATWCPISPPGRHGAVSGVSGRSGNSRRAARFGRVLRRPAKAPRSRPSPAVHGSAQRGGAAAGRRLRLGVDRHALRWASSDIPQVAPMAAPSIPLTAITRDRVISQFRGAQ